MNLILYLSKQSVIFMHYILGRYMADFEIFSEPKYFFHVHGIPTFVMSAPCIRFLFSIVKEKGVIFV